MPISRAGETAGIDLPCDMLDRLHSLLDQIAAHGRFACRCATPGISAIERHPSVITHKFNPGQTVKLIPSAYIRDSQGDFEILRVLPEEHGMHQYHIKSATDGIVRVVMESEIA
jgi:hypothetical protein